MAVTFPMGLTFTRLAPFPIRCIADCQIG